MLRVVEDLCSRAFLNNLAGVHHTHAITDAPHDTKVVGDQQDGRAGLLTQYRHEVEHLGLNRCVEACRRLVEDQELRFTRQRHRDHHALLHAARELIRIAIKHLLGIGNAHAMECLFGLDLRLGLREAQHGEGLDDLHTHLERRIERLARILVDH